jgi:hypothetical protein
LVAAAGGYGVYMLKPEWFGKETKAKGIFTPTFEDYQKVYDHVARLLEEKDDYDDGSYGPVLLRLAWHASGTYVASTPTPQAINMLTQRSDTISSPTPVAPTAQPCASPPKATTVPTLASKLPATSSTP